MSHRRLTLFAAGPVALAAASAVARGQFQTSGTDFSPVNVSGQVATNAHNDGTGTDTANVRVSAYYFQSDPGDPNFTQDPGFNAPAGSGLPAGDVFSFSVLDSLKYWNGTGPVALAAPTGGDSVQYSFGASSRTVTGTSGPQSGFNIGAVASNGALHKHLNAFLQDATGSYDPSATPTPGVYVTQLQLNSTSLLSSKPIFAVYDNGQPQGAVDRAKFYVRNHFAPGSELVQTSTSMIGLSAQPGEANLAAGGQVTVTGSNGNYASQVNTLTTAANKGSVVINAIAPADPVYALLWFGGASADVSSLIANLNVPDYYTIVPSTVPATNAQYATVQRLAAKYPGFAALAEFTPTADDAAFTFDFSANPTVTLTQFAAVSNGSGNTIVSGQWAKSTGGTWGTAGNWANGAVPTNAGDTATFGAVLTAPSTVSLDSGRTVGHLVFNSATAYTIGAGGGTLTINDAGGTGIPDVTVAAGSHVVAAPVAVAAGVTVNASTGTALLVSGRVTGTGPVTKVGAGTLTLAAADAYAGATNVSGGTLAFAAPGALPAGSALTVGAGATAAAAAHAGGAVNANLLVAGGLTLAGSTGAWTGRVDLSNNALVVQAGNLATVTSQVAQGYAGGRWQASGGIVSGSAAADGARRTALGVVPNSTTGVAGGPALYGSGTTLGLFDGASPSAADVLVRYTYYGDANLDGRVDGQDYGRIDAGYAARTAANPLTGWFNGDFNYDGKVDGSDYTLIDNAFNTQSVNLAAAAEAVPTAERSPGVAAVPEPAAACLLGVAAWGWAGRRRRR